MAKRRTRLPAERATCESNTNCHFYSFWDTGWCRTTSTCSDTKQQARYKINIIGCSTVTSPPPAPHPPPPLPPTSTSGYVTTTSTELIMPFSGYTSKITPTACVLSGSWISTTGTPGVGVTGSNVGSD